MSFGAYCIAIACMAAVVAGAAAGAIALRRRWLPSWEGSPARLAEIVLAVTLVVVVGEVAGTFGLLERGPIVVAMVGVGGALWWSTSRGSAAPGERPSPAPRPPHPVWAARIAAVMATVVVYEWAAGVRHVLRLGLTDVDSLHYHLPIAARFAQTGNVSQLHFLWIDPVWTFYPANSELLHGMGMVLSGRDLVTPLLNLGWLGVALLAAWVLGRPHGLAPLTLAAVLIVLAAPFFALIEPGSALTDIPTLALLLTAVALFGQGDRTTPAIAVAGLAAGLAVGTKLTAAGPVAAMTLAVVLTARRPERLRVAGAWVAAALVGGGYWFVRNLVRTGNPLPWFALPGLSSPDFPALDAYGHSVLRYAGDGKFWREYVDPGLRLNFGSAYALVLAAAGVAFVAGALAAWQARGQREATSGVRVILLAVSVLGGAVYLAMPVAAFGPPGDPWQFGLNLRYSFPSMACGLLLGAFACRGRSQRFQGTAMAVAAIVVGVEVASPAGPRESALARSLLAAVALVGLGILVAHLRPHLPGGRRTLAAGALAVTFLVVVAGHRLAEPYLEDRYAGDAVGAWAQTVRGGRIAIVGFGPQYILVGPDLSNHVQYLGEEARGGRFDSLRTCAALRAALRAGEYEFLVAGSHKWDLQSAPEADWATMDPAATPVIEAGAGGADRTVVFRLDPSAPPSEDGCAVLDQLQTLR